MQKEEVEKKGVTSLLSVLLFGEKWGRGDVCLVGKVKRKGYVGGGEKKEKEKKEKGWCTWVVGEKRKKKIIIIINNVIIKFKSKNQNNVPNTIFF
jgi:hypothetical protein